MIKIINDHRVVSRIVQGEVQVSKCHLYETTDELQQRATEKVRAELLKMGVIQNLEHVWDIDLSGPWSDPENREVESFNFEYTIIESKEDSKSSQYGINQYDDNQYVPGNSPSMQPEAPFDSCGHHNETMNMCDECGFWMCQDCEKVHVCTAIQDEKDDEDPENIEDTELWLESLEEEENDHVQDEW